MFVNAYVKDYEIEIDGGKETIKNERWLGWINQHDGTRYFVGEAFSYNEKKNTYDLVGEIIVTMAEFNARIRTATFFK
jgi:hypothetical protein